MKKIVLFLVLSVFLVPTLLYSQEKAIVFGFKVAPNVGWMRPDARDYARDGASPGFSWGFKTEILLMENTYLATGFNVIYLNSKLNYPEKRITDEDTLSGTLNRKFKLKYIQVPLKIKLKTNWFGKFRIYGDVGLGTGFLIDANADDVFKDEDNQFEKTEDKVDIYDDIVFLRLSLLLGAGAELNLGGSTALFAGFGFDNGFMNILKGKNNLNEVNQKAFANFVEFHIGIVF